MTGNSVVFGAILIIWVGIFLYLMALDALRPDVS